MSISALKEKKNNITVEFCVIKLGTKFDLGTKYELKLTILIFFIKFSQKGYFQSKTEKVNITTDFCIF